MSDATGSTPREVSIRVQRTARYYVLGTPDPSTRSLWVALHGYGQLGRYFIRHFRPFADDARVIVAPEALSRLYLSTDYTRVGASWMTKEAREDEIADYLAYLDAVADEVLAGVDRETVDLGVFGFSQGVATATRWAALGGYAVDRLILWGGRPAHDLDPDALDRLRRIPMDLVVGTDDEFVTPERLAEVKTWLDTQQMSYRPHRFDGGHHLDAETLAAVMHRKG